MGCVPAASPVVPAIYKENLLENVTYRAELVLFWRQSTEYSGAAHLEAEPQWSRSSRFAAQTTLRRAICEDESSSSARAHWSAANRYGRVETRWLISRCSVMPHGRGEAPRRRCVQIAEQHGMIEQSYGVLRAARTRSNNNRRGVRPGKER